MSQPSYGDWERLHRRTLLVTPLTTARNLAVPAVIAMIGIGSRQPWFLVVGAVVLAVASIGFGTLIWFTTSFRVADGALVVRRGVLARKVLNAPVDRIRSVDLEASLLHRVLKLQKVKVGTGVDDAQIELDALSDEQAESLRSLLLSLTPTNGPAATEAATPTEAPDPHAATDSAAPVAHQPQQVLATLNPRWAFFAPFSLARLAVVAGAAGALTQLDLPVLETGEAIWDELLRFSLILVVIGLVVVALLAWTALSVVSYLISWWDLRLFREDGNLRLTRGLFTTASTTVEVARIRGVQLSEPLLLRTAGGAETKALVTGLDQGVYAVLPQAPRAVAVRVAQQVLASGEAPASSSYVDPLTVALAAHGRAARRRCLVRAQLGLTGWIAPVALGLVVFDQIPVTVALVAVAAAALIALLIGSQTYRHLGHALTEDHLVVGHGALTRHRSVLERGGVIGWVLSESIFQRRAGLVTLVATTAAGNEQVTLRDVPRSEAEALGRSITPAWAA